MILSAHQPTYCGYLGTFHKMDAADVWVDWDAVQAEDSGFENRTRILGRDGRVFWLTVPAHKRRAKVIRDIEVVQNGWQRKHWRTIQNAYILAPCWEEHAPFLEQFYMTEHWKWLHDLDGTFRTYVASCLGTSKPTRTQTGLDLEKSESPTGDIVRACEALGADSYLFGPQGRRYADLTLMRTCGIKDLHQKYEPVAYPQGRVTWPRFEPNLWPLDALMWLGREEARKVMLAGGTVVAA